MCAEACHGCDYMILIYMIIASPCSVGGYYGFAERIIDGMYLSINSVVVNFKATAFAASFQVCNCYKYLKIGKKCVIVNCIMKDGKYM